jgi:hypothetical protein
MAKKQNKKLEKAIPWKEARGDTTGTRSFGQFLKFLSEVKEVSEETKAAVKAATKTIDNTNIFREGVLISFRSRMWGATGKLADDKYSLVDETIDPKKVKASIELLNDTSILDDMRSVRGQAVRLISLNSIYSPDKGLHFIRKSRIEYVYDRLSDYKKQFEELGEALISKLKELEKDFATKHPQLYNPDKYPSDQTLRRIIKFEFVLRVFTVPDKELGIISPEIYKKELEKAKNDIEEMKQFTTNEVCKEIMNRISILKEQCETGNVSQATLGGFQTFIERFENVWDGFIGEADVQKMLEDIRLYLQDTDADMIRYDDEFRQMVANKSAKIAKSLETKGYTRALDF